MKDTLAKNVRETGNRLIEADRLLRKASLSWTDAIIQGDKEAKRSAEALVKTLHERRALLEREYVKHQKLWKEAT
tara:strand:- start:235 stop:459 length:225 start_codon:yes stop_codon:yes gene_type:complete